MTEVIIYAAIATIICVMLYSVLGKSVGSGPEAPLEGFDLTPKAPEEKPVIIDPIAESGEFPQLNDIIKLDSSFTTAGFLDSAQGAYAMVLEAFADGDRDSLKMLLMPHVYEVYDAAISQREDKNLKQVTDLARIIDASINAVRVQKNTGFISTEFHSELASALLDDQGAVIEGDPDVLGQVREIWTFERNLKGSDPAWYLSDVAPAEGGDNGPDAAPDTVS